MRKRIVTIALAMFLMSCVGYAQPKSDKDNPQPPRRQPTHHWIDKDAQSHHEHDKGDRYHNSESRDRFDREERSEHHRDGDDRYHHRGERDRHEGDERFHHDPDKDDQYRHRTDKDKNDKDERSQFQSHHRDNLTPPTPPAPSPLNPVPGYKSRPGSIVSNANPADMLSSSEMPQVINDFLNMSSLLH